MPEPKAAPPTRVPPVSLPLHEIRAYCQEYDKEFRADPAPTHAGLSVWSYIEYRLDNQGTPVEREGAFWAALDATAPDWWSV